MDYSVTGLCLRPSSIAKWNTTPRMRLHSLASATAGPDCVLPGVRCCPFMAQQRRQPLAPPALTGWPQSALRGVCVSGFRPKRRKCVPNAPRAQPTLVPGAWTESSGHDPTTESPAVAAKEVGMGNPAEERPPPG
jgi:hypothetical protein